MRYWKSRLHAAMGSPIPRIGIASPTGLGFPGAADAPVLVEALVKIESEMNQLEIERPTRRLALARQWRRAVDQSLATPALKFPNDPAPGRCAGPPWTDRRSKWGIPTVV